MSDIVTPSINSTADSGALLGVGAVIVWNDVVGEGRAQFYDWHDKEHIPERLSIRGFRRGRRYINAGQSPEWLTLYEADDLSVLTSTDYLTRLNAPSPLTQSTLGFFRNTSRAVCRIAHTTGGSSGGHMLSLRINVPAASTERFVDHVTSTSFRQAMATRTVVACHLFAADPEASFIDTAESKTRTFDVPSWVILCEATTRDGALAARAAIDGGAFDRMQVEVRPDGGVYSLEICRLPRPVSAMSV